VCFVHGGTAPNRASSHAMAKDSAFKMLMTKEALVKKKKFVAFPDIQKILKNGVLTVSLLQDDIFPFFFYDKDAGFLGIDRQLINSIARALGPNVKLKIIRTAKTYDDIIKQVSAGRAHLGISKINYTPSRSLQVLYGDESYITLHPALLLHKKERSQKKDKFDAGQFFKAKNKRKICTISRSSNTYTVNELFPGAIIVASKNEKIRDRKFVEGKCDALFLDDYDVEKKFTEDPFLKTYYEAVVLDKVETPAYIVTNPKYPNLSSFIDDLVRNTTSLQFELHTSFDQYKHHLKPLRERQEKLALKKEAEEGADSSGNNTEEDEEEIQATEGVAS